MSTSHFTVKTRLDARLANGPINYAEFIEIALYTPKYGYYMRNRPRVGRSGKTDFYTSESLGPVFARLVIEASISLLPEDLASRDATFVEIGAEPGRCILDLVKSHPFRASRVIRPGDPCQVDDISIVFANEWLDALPFHRLCFIDGSWRERGVNRNAEGNLVDCLLPSLSEEVQQRIDKLPSTAPEGWQLDWPIAAEAALGTLANSSWRGALILIDYGRRLEALLESHPEGTARTYQSHSVGPDLLVNPGEQDITCDVIWDPLESILRKAGFSSVNLRRQETFFVEVAARAIGKIVTKSPGTFNPDRLTLMELLHPGNLGAKFQALSAHR